jgi:hypothetical protein
MEDFNMYPDSVLLNKKEMSRALFLENVENPKKTVHYTGMLCDYWSRTCI